MDAKLRGTNRAPKDEVKTRSRGAKEAKGYVETTLVKCTSVTGRGRFHRLNSKETKWLAFPKRTVKHLLEREQVVTQVRLSANMLEQV